MPWHANESFFPLYLFKMPLLFLFFFLCPDVQIISCFCLLCWGSLAIAGRKTEIQYHGSLKSEQAESLRNDCVHSTVGGNFLILSQLKSPLQHLLVTHAVSLVCRVFVAILVTVLNIISWEHLPSPCLASWLKGHIFLEKSLEGWNLFSVSERS